MKYVSLFAGIGGFDLALNRLGHVCVWANEWDKYAAQVYRKNFVEGNRKQQENAEVGGSGNSISSQKSEPNQPKEWGNNLGIDTRDIRTISTSEIPNHDLLVGGFPCQAFSVAGKRRGFDDTRGTLFFEIARVLKDKQPKFFILENVKGLLSHANGNTFKVIISTLTELGYDLQWQVVNSKNFGVPQNRERVFIVGHLRGTSRPEVFPITETGGQNRLTDNAIAWSKSHRTGKAPEDYQRKNRGKTELRFQAGIANTLNAGEGGSSQSTATFVNKESMIRRLTPTECERLQGFPDGWTEGISDTQRYKCLGNAVTVNVVFEIAKRFS